MAKKKLYETLGAEESDDAEAIKRRYRKRSKECHPDKRPGDDAAKAEFLAVSEAFRILSDPVKRIEYDRTGQIPADDNNPLQQALAVLGSLLLGILRSSTDAGLKITQRDLVAELKANLDKQIQQFGLDLEQMQSEKELLTDIADRFTCKKGQDNVLANMARAPIAMLDRNMVAVEAMAKIHSDAYKIVKKFKFRRDVIEIVMMMDTGSGTTTSGGWD